MGTMTSRILMAATASATTSTKVTSTAFAALIWWVVPFVLVSCAIGYVVWTAKYKQKFENQTNRSVDKFKLFQETLRNPESQ